MSKCDEHQYCKSMEKMSISSQCSEETSRGLLCLELEQNAPPGLFAMATSDKFGRGEVAKKQVYNNGDSHG